MGYTHYWTRIAAINPDAWSAFLADLAKIREKLPMDLKIMGGHGTDEPRFDLEMVWFNGTSEADLGHETFMIERIVENPSTSPDIKYTRPGDDWSFCKTARKPYDLFVTAALLAAKNRFEKDFAFSSDGGESEWEPAFRLVRDALEIDGRAVWERREER